MLAKDYRRSSILVVDDNEVNRAVLLRCLEQEGYLTASAENGRIALERMALEQFDLVLLDIVMPELDGHEVLRQVRSDPRHRQTRIIMITAKNDAQSALACISGGANDYILKPFNILLIKSRVWRCVSTGDRRDAVMAASGSNVPAATVLVVNHDAKERDTLARRVEQLGHRVIQAHDAGQAITILGRQSVQAVLLNIDTPELTGQELHLLQHVQAHPELRHTPIIALSAQDDNVLINACMKAGAVDFITKPFNAVLFKVHLDSCIRAALQLPPAE